MTLDLSPLITDPWPLTYDLCPLALTLDPYTWPLISRSRVRDQGSVVTYQGSRIRVRVIARGWKVSGHYQGHWSEVKDQSQWSEVTDQWSLVRVTCQGSLVSQGSLDSGPCSWPVTHYHWPLKPYPWPLTSDPLALTLDAYLWFLTQGHRSGINATLITDELRVLQYVRYYGVFEMLNVDNMVHWSSSWVQKNKIIFKINLKYHTNAKRINKASET